MGVGKGEGDLALSDATLLLTTTASQKGKKKAEERVTAGGLFKFRPL